MSFLFGRGRAAANRKIIERLYADIVEAVRRPVFYEAGGVPDSFEGRFELLVLHAGLVVRRLRVLGAPAPSAAQDLIDTVFRHLDPALRELGVGDMAVPKRMKRLAEGFLGRTVAYDAALAGADEIRLIETLSRNVYGRSDGQAAPAIGLARYCRVVDRTLGDLGLPGFLDAPLRFPDPAEFFLQSAA